MGRCGECRWRKRAWPRDEGDWAVCQQADRQTSQGAYGLFYVRGGHMATHKDFGCVYFEKREVSE
jgi:hypothetical protein